MSSGSTNVMSIVGFVLSFFVPIAGLVCSIIGLKQCKASGDGEGRGFAIAGIVISSISVAGYVFALLWLLGVFAIGFSLIPFVA